MTKHLLVLRRVLPVLAISIGCTRAAVIIDDYQQPAPGGQTANIASTTLGTNLDVFTMSTGLSGVLGGSRAIYIQRNENSGGVNASAAAVKGQGSPFYVASFTTETSTSGYASFTYDGGTGYQLLSSAPAGSNAAPSMNTNTGFGSTDLTQSGTNNSISLSLSQINNNLTSIPLIITFYTDSNNWRSLTTQMPLSGSDQALHLAMSLWNNNALPGSGTVNFSNIRAISLIINGLGASRNNGDISLFEADFVTPEPSSIALMGTGLVAFAFAARRKMKR